MIRNAESIKSKIAEFFGRSVSKVTSLAYIFEHGEPDPIEIQIWFMHQFVGVGCSSDGESILITDSISKEVYMDEFGELKIVNVSSQQPYSNLVSMNLIDCELWKNEYEIICGVEFVFDSDARIILFNLGDDLRVFTETPAFFADEGYSRILK